MFGVVGGYGATGRAVVSELCKSSSGEIAVAGRDPTKAKALATQFDGRVSATVVDALDDRALDAFCQQCSIIINCAGPVMRLGNRIAQAAFRNRCHYVDAAGLGIVKENLLPHAREIEKLGLSFVISAGWMPGISEVVPAYAEKQARSKMGSIDSVTVCFGDSGEWSDNALRDAFWFIRRVGFRGPGYFHKGTWTRARASTAICKIDLGEPIGSRRFGLYSTPEFEEIGQRLGDCDFFCRPYLSGFRTALSTTLLAMFPLPETTGIRLLRNAFRRNRLPADGFVWVEVKGRSSSEKLKLVTQIVYRERRDYWANAAALANVALMTAEGSARKGVHFLADAVDPAVFVDRLQKAGFEQREAFGAYN